MNRYDLQGQGITQQTTPGLHWAPDLSKLLYTSTDAQGGKLTTNFWRGFRKAEPMVRKLITHMHCQAVLDLGLLG